MPSIWPCVDGCSSLPIVDPHWAYSLVMWCEPLPRIIPDTRTEEAILFPLRALYQPKLGHRPPSHLNKRLKYNENAFIISHEHF